MKKLYLFMLLAFSIVSTTKACFTPEIDAKFPHIEYGTRVFKNGIDLHTAYQNQVIHYDVGLVTCSSELYVTVTGGTVIKDFTYLGGSSYAGYFTIKWGSGSSGTAILKNISDGSPIDTIIVSLTNNCYSDAAPSSNQGGINLAYLNRDGSNALSQSMAVTSGVLVNQVVQYKVFKEQSPDYTPSFSVTGGTINQQYVDANGDYCVEVQWGTSAGTGTLQATSATMCSSTALNVTIEGLSVGSVLSIMKEQQSYSLTYIGGNYLGNQFQVQLSDQTGSFSSPTVIGSKTGAAGSGTINVTIPSGITAGTAYRVRIVSISPASTGNDNGSDIQIITHNFSMSSISATQCTGYTNPLQVFVYGNQSYYTGSNVFKLQLSDKNGSFANPTEITTGSSWNGPPSPQIRFVVLTNMIPHTVPYGTGYRVRVVSTDPAITFPDNGSDITINKPYLYFDGNDDKATISGNSAYNLGAGNFTLEAWVNLSSSQTYTSLPVIQKVGDIVKLKFSIENGTSLDLQVGGNSGNYEAVSKTFTSILDNACHHIAVVRKNGSEVYFYVDGVDVTKTTMDDIASGKSIDGPTNPLIIGDKVKGYIYDVRFWNIQRSGSDINTYKQAFFDSGTSNLIGLWKSYIISSSQVWIDESATNNTAFLGTTTSSESSDPSVNCGILCNPNARVAQIQVLDDDYNVTDLSTTTKIYPNPTAGVVNISALAGSTVVISNQYGEIMHTNKISDSSYLFDTANLAPGLYIIVYEDLNGDTQQEKLTVIR